MSKFFFKLLLLITFLPLSNANLFAQYTWTKYIENPLELLNGASGSWNRNVCEASILYNADSSRYEMWFSGTSGNPVFPYRIGFAKSVDGISWDMHPDPVLTPTSGTWDQNNVQFPFVIRENGQYKMWYSSSPQSNYNQSKIGYATSPDGIEWTKDTLHNPIFEPGTDPWEAGGVMACYVMPVSGGYKIWYSGFTTSAINGNVYIGYATSVDGISWQRDTINNPVLEPGVTGLWDGKWVWYPEVLFIDNLYYMYYAGTNTGYWGRIDVGLATSTDGITQWIKQPDPVLSPSSGMWDWPKVECSSIELIGDSLLWMWYSGNASFIQFGLATSSIISSVEQETTQPTEFALEQNYPNPFNPSTVISYQLPVGSDVTLKVYDILGNEVATLIDEYKPAGKYEVEFNALALSGSVSAKGGYASGVYFYQLLVSALQSKDGKAGNFIETKKMVLMK